MLPVRPNLHQGAEHEISLMHPRVWQDQTWLIENEIVHRDEIEIDGPGLPRLDIGTTPSAKRLLDFEEMAQQRLRRARRIEG